MNTTHITTGELYLGCSDLLTDYLSSSERALLNQKYANLLQYQEDLYSDHLSSDLAVKSAAFQEQLKMQAHVYTNANMSELISNLTLGSSFSALASALRSILREQGTDGFLPNASMIAQEFNTLKGEAESNAIQSKLLFQKLGVMNTEVSNIDARYTEVINDIEQALNQEIKQTVEEITQLNQEISANIQAIIDGGKEVGEGIGKIGVAIIASINVDHTGKPKGESSEDGELESDHSKPSTQYIISGINSIMDGTTETSEAVRQLARNNERLAELYQELAEENSLLSAAKSIQAQNDLFIDQVALTYGAWTNVETHWNIVADQFAAAATIVASASTEQEIQNVIHALELGDIEWNALDDQIDNIKAVYAGITN